MCLVNRSWKRNELVFLPKWSLCLKRTVGGVPGYTSSCSPEDLYKPQEIIQREHSWYPSIAETGWCFPVLVLQLLKRLCFLAWLYVASRAVSSTGREGQVQALYVPSTVHRHLSCVAVMGKGLRSPETFLFLASHKKWSPVTYSEQQ